MDRKKQIKMRTEMEVRDKIRKESSNIIQLIRRWWFCGRNNVRSFIF